MHKRRTRRARRTRHRLEEQATVDLASAPAPAAQREQLGPLYNAGPVHALPPQSGVRPAARTGEEEAAAAPVMDSPEMEEAATAATAPASYQEQMPTLKGEGAPSHAVAFNGRGPLRLRGRTDATYDGGRFQTQNVTVRPGTGCTDCAGRQCIHVTGTLEATYSVSTTVTLPRVADFPDLTPCQRRRVQDAIDNILAPHEQQHVQAFAQYNGTTRRAFDLTLCRSAFDGAIQRMFEAEEQARRAAAQAASDALDPFHFDVDLDCEEPRQPPAQGHSTVSAAENPPEEDLA